MFLLFRNLNTVRAISREHEHPVDRYSVMAKWYAACNYYCKFHFINYIRDCEDYFGYLSAAFLPEFCLVHNLLCILYMIAFPQKLCKMH